MKEKNKIPLGTTDYYGKEAILRDFVLKNIEKIYKKYGFEPLYTPVLENEEVFMGHHGEGEKLLFRLSDIKGSKYVLKYDSTVPLARVVSMHNDIQLPYKRYQLQQSYRDDEVDKGHYREFIQCDGDIVGANSLISDAELVSISYDGLISMGFDEFTIRLNHRKIIKGIAEKANMHSKEDLLEIQRAIDYADKIVKNGVFGIKCDLERRKVNSSVIDIIVDLINISSCSGDVNEILCNINNYFDGYSIAQEGVSELSEIVSYLPNEILEKVKIDFTLARGADYYTGFILEAVINNIQLGAVLGGGRYDDLVSAFNDKNIPAVGMAFGMERIIVAMKELGLDKKFNFDKKMLIYADDSYAKNAIDIVRKLREKYDVSLVFSSDLPYPELINYCEKSYISLLGVIDSNGNIEINKINGDENYYNEVCSDAKKYVMKKYYDEILM